MKKLSIINENIFDGIGKRSKGSVVRKENEVKSVDLGLPSGTIWAACNLGASSPEEYGDYYSWGETKPKDKYTWNTYKFGTKDNLTKYNEEDRKTILDPEDDAAHVVLGGKWHIPTREQMQELFYNTTNEDSEFDGVKGKLFTSKINGKELFFPYSGNKDDNFIDGENEYCFHWSSSITDYNYATKFYCDDDTFSPFQPEISKACKFLGFSVRGVLDKK